MAHSGEKGEFNGLALIARQIVQTTMKKTPQVGTLNIIIESARLRRSRRLMIKLRFVTLLGPAIRLFPAQPIDRAATRQSYDPAKQLARFWRITVGFAP